MAGDLFTFAHNLSEISFRRESVQLGHLIPQLIILFFPQKILRIHLMLGFRFLNAI
jgi:hypothetical protein